MKYRSDIDGLRAIAVGSVLLYHARLLGVTGGFVGVDVFFVISGFLITGVLRANIEAGKYSILDFYDRRIRRILPAYTGVAVATTLAALVILPPQELANYGRRLASTAAFVSNFLFASEASYFGPSSADNPLLHTWSLSVEEQFYVVWPILMMLLATPLLVRLRRWVVVAAFVVSFGLAAVFTILKPMAAFYSSPLRAWELLLGAMLVLDIVPTAKGRWREAGAKIGLLLLLAPMFLYHSGNPPFPGLAALPPCLGAALIIHCNRDGPTWVGKLLSWQPMVMVGLISYSLYLWHWPILVFLGLELSRPLAPLEAAGALALSGLLAWMSWKFIERPFRGHAKRWVGKVPISVPFAVAVLVILLGLGLWLNASNGLPGRASAAALTAAKERDMSARGPKGCHVSATSVKIPQTGCLLGAGKDTDVSVVLLGDSHAAAFAPGLDLAARQVGFTARQWTKSSCAPLLEVARPAMSNEADESCRTYMKAAVDRLAKDPGVKTVVLAGYWSNLRGANGGPETTLLLANQSGLEAGLDRIVSTLTAEGKQVILLGQTPVYSNGGGACVVRARFRNRDTDRCAELVLEEDALLGPSDRILRMVAERHPGVRVFVGSRLFCDMRLCRPLTGGHVAMRDGHHLNRLGSEALAPKLAPLFEGVER